MSKQFHLGDILSITTGRLVSPRHIDGVYDILNYMTGDDLFTHQLPRASEECRPYLLIEMPWLEKIDANVVNGENWESWLKEQVKKYGEYHEVRPIHPEDHENIDPVDELKRMGVEDSRIIAVDLTDKESPSPYGDINWKTEKDGEDEDNS